MSRHNGFMIQILSIWLISFICVDSQSEENIRTGSQCFHVKGVPTLNLRCPGGELIDIKSAFYGAPPSNTSCTYEDKENHCIQLTNMHENCNGRYVCSVYVSNPFLMNCRTYANYMQVNYTCTPKPVVHDICESMTVTSESGYIRTPHYPDANYTANLHCACRLKTNDRAIVLKVLDFSVNHTKPGECESDYLRIVKWGKKCGHIGPERLPEMLEVDRNDLTLEFHSNDYFQSRGFWLQYSGTSGGKVAMTCGPVTKKTRESENEVEINPNDPFNIGGDQDGRDPDTGDSKIVLIDDSDTFPGGHDDHTKYKEKTPTKLAPSLTDKERAELDKRNEINRENEIDDSPTTDDDFFNTYDFNETQESYYAYNIDTVQIITGCVVGVLILIAVVIIIVLVFRR